MAIGNASTAVSWKICMFGAIGGSYLRVDMSVLLESFQNIKYQTLELYLYGSWLLYNFSTLAQSGYGIHSNSLFIYIIYKYHININRLTYINETF